MREVFVLYDDRIVGDDGESYTAAACGSRDPDGRWQGWIEFTPARADSKSAEPSASMLATSRETVQPNRADLEYWAQGLTHVFLQGALRRAIAASSPPGARTTPVADRREPAPMSPRSVLDPFLVFAQGGERLLTQELGALSAAHLRAILASVRQQPSSEEMASATAPTLIREIVDAVLEQIPRPSTSRSDTSRA